MTISPFGSTKLVVCFRIVKSALGDMLWFFSGFLVIEPSAPLGERVFWLAAFSVDHRGRQESAEVRWSLLKCKVLGSCLVTGCLMLEWIKNVKLIKCKLLLLIRIRISNTANLTLQNAKSVVSLVINQKKRMLAIVRSTTVYKRFGVLTKADDSLVSI